MVNLILGSQPDDWTEVFTPAQLYMLSRTMLKLSWYLDWYLRNGVRLGDVFSTYTCFRELGVQMPRKGKISHGSNTVNAGNGDRRAGGNVEWKWCNIRLSDEDVEFLSQSDSTLEYLAACAVALADDGIGFKIEPTDGGKSIRATLYRPDTRNGNVIIGVSSYSGTVRDALLACLYKLDTYLGGDFSTVPEQTDPEGARPRFR